jgi:WD40 repeat protein
MKPSQTQATFSGHNGAIYSAAFSPLLNQWITAGGDGIVAAWDEDGQGSALMHHAQAFYSVACAGEWTIAGTASGEVMFAGHHGSEPARVNAHQQGVFAIVWDGNHLWTGGGDGKLIRWELAGNAWKSIQVFTVPEPSKIRFLCPSPKGMLLGTSGGWLGKLYENQFLSFASNSDAAHYAGIFLPEKEAWIVASGDGHLSVFDETGKSVYRFPAHEGPIYRLVLAGECIWSASRDKRIKSWNVLDLAAQECIAFKSGGHHRSINALALAPKAAGFQMLSAGDDRVARLHNLTRSGFLSTNPQAPTGAPSATDSLG